jgi:hypothetical protein
MRFTTGSTGVTSCGKHGGECAATEARRAWIARRWKTSSSRVAKCGTLGRRAYYMHRWPSPKATKRRRDRVREITDKRASRTGNIVSGVPQDGQLRVHAVASVDVAAGWAEDAAGSLEQPAVLGNGSVSIAWNRALPGASRISKIIVKPCAGRPHGRFARGLLKTGWLS